MYTLISIFYASFLGMIAMIALKRHEVKTGHPSLVSRFGAGTDHVFQAAYSRVRHVLSFINRHTFVALMHWVAFHALSSVRKVYVDVKDRFISTHHGRKLIDAVRGRGEIQNHGASFYLRHIAAESKRS